uniref:Large ribosomal subunit protein mL37 n=1 Tax=Timema monikensis TaxID=170555 RepID=A0A7R9E219_9NEOP|nr:unnamed protein product [Timema monikensis]
MSAFLFFHESRLLTYRLIQLCGSISGSPRPVVNHTPVKVTLDRGGNLVQLGIRADQLLVAKTPLSPLVDQYSTSGMELPNLGQAHFTVSLETDHFYQDIDIYPTGNWAPHTLVLHGNQSEVYNLYETPVTEQQWLGRSLVSSFIVAAAYARAQFGAGVEDLPHPVCVQCCHTDGRLFHFVVLQLNTLGVGTELRNILWSQPRVALFDTCGYKNGRPELTGYNGDVHRSWDRQGVLSSPLVSDDGWGTVNAPSTVANTDRVVGIGFIIVLARFLYQPAVGFFRARRAAVTSARDLHLSSAGLLQFSSYTW